MALEVLRSRQAILYYTHWQQFQEYLHADSKQLQANPFEVTRNDHASISSQDRALTAFAQLVALRLSCKRALITVVGSDVEYVLAEATQSLSLMKDDTHSLGDEMLFGRRVIEREKGFGAKILNSYYQQEKDQHEASAHLNIVTIDDCFEAADFKDNELVRRHEIRSLIGIPIRTRRGLCIGTLLAFPSEPGVTVSAQDAEFLSDVSDTVFEHLYLAKAQRDCLQGVVMMNELSSFISNSAKTPGSRRQSADSGIPKPRQASIAERRRDSNAPDIAEEDSQASGQAVAIHRRSKQDQSAARHISIPDAGNDSLDKIPSLKGMPLSVQPDVDRVFARAAVALCTATSADGCIFFDVNDVADLPSPFEDNGTEQEESGENSYGVSDGYANQDRKDLHNLQSASDYSSPTSSQDINAKVIASHIAATAAHDGNETAKFNLTNADIQRLIESYPYGKVFDFANSEYLPNPDTESSSEGGGTNTGTRPDIRSQTGKETKGAIARNIIRMIPHVTTAVFLPMWHFGRERWFSFAVLWTTQVGRSLYPTEGLSYLKAFSSSVMSAVSRLHTIGDDSAKTTFIASISHELRSPLHGLLGGVEFLYDTELTFGQQNLLRSIENCGKTLLDTIGHVLDFSNINSVGNFSKKQERYTKNGQRRPSKNSGFQEAGLTKSFDLLSLIEDVVEAAYSGQVFRSRKQQEEEDLNIMTPTLNSGLDLRADQTKPKRKPPAEPRDRVAISIHVVRNQSWKVNSVSGAIRRIVMNLFGNSLKYTSDGEIKVFVQPSSSVAQQGGKLAVDLVFKDTGRGLSDWYLREKLFQPFAQEDPFSAGMGLGLNIVNQLVNALDGKIDVRSTLGEGTEITVTLNLQAVEEAVAEDSMEIINTRKEAWKGASACMLIPSFDIVPDIKTGSRLRSVMANILINLFSMTVTETDDKSTSDSDIYIFFEIPPIIDDLIEQIRNLHAKVAIGDRRPGIILLCGNQFQAAEVRHRCSRLLSQTDINVEVVTQPLGPIKVARTLERFSRSSKMKFQHDTLPELLAKPEQQPCENIDTLPTETEPYKYEKSPMTMAPTIGSSPNDPTMEARQDSIAQSKAGDYMPSLVTVKDSLPSPSPSPPDQLAKDSTVKTNASWPFVLIVDDNNVNLRLLKMLMQKNRVPHVSAMDGQEALNIYKEHANSVMPIDFIFMDISMPVMDGLESTREIRQFEQREQKSRATIIALSALGDEQTQAKAKQIGFDDFLSKPANMKGIIKLLEAWKAK